MAPSPPSGHLIGSFWGSVLTVLSTVVSGDCVLVPLFRGSGCLRPLKDYSPSAQIPNQKNLPIILSPVVIIRCLSLTCV